MKIIKVIIILMVLAGLGLVVVYYFNLAWVRPTEENKVVADVESLVVATSTQEIEEVKNEVVQTPVTVLAFGDLLLDRYIKLYIDRQGADYPLENIKEVFAGNDLVLANLEGSFTDFKPRKLDPNNTSFTFDPKLAPMLKEAGFNILNLANNHVQDFGKEGFSLSQAYLDKAGISHFGDFYNESPAVMKEIRGMKIAFIGYNEFGKPAIESTIAKIKETAPKADYTVVYAHWGAEYQTSPWPGSQQKGRQFIDAGADIILGSHPHVIQPIEIYKGKPIFYSLGNFVFDQIFSFDVRHGLGVRLVLDKDRGEFELIPTEMKNFQVNLAGEETKTAILNKIAAGFVGDEAIKEGIAKGQFALER